jgi:hypothetical protein
MNFGSIEPNIRTDCIDFIIVSNRSLNTIDKVFKEAALNPSKWMNHHFYVVYDTEEECKILKAWVEEAREFMSLPKITTVLAAPENIKNVTALRQQGLEQGSNPYIYFQDDDDPLPMGVDRRMKMMDSNNWVAIYGLTRSVGPRGQLIEEFPTLAQDNFMYEPVEATKLFPTYTHPLAALFKRSLFDKVSLGDDHRYQYSGSNAFCVRLFMSGLPIHFLPDVVRTVRHHTGNNNGIFQKTEASQLAHDIHLWQEHIQDTDILQFQKNIAQSLIDGRITTYREIDAQVEEKMEDMHKIY